MRTAMSAVGVQAVAANLLSPRRLREFHRRVARATAQWTASSNIARDFGVVIGFGYDDSKLAKQRHPTAEDLDAVSTELPMILIVSLCAASFVV